MDQHSIASDLLFSVVAETKADELTVFERLYIAENAGVVSHGGWHADLYIKCGCLEKAFQYYEAHNHIRKLGDVSWARGDLDLAHQYYSVPGSRDGQSSRYEKDWDRLIKLSFFRSDWSAVVRLLLEAPISSSPLKKTRIVLGNSEVSGMPYIKMLAVAACKSATPALER